MKKLATWTIRYRALVIILCFALLVPSVLGMAATKTKYDLLYYLPQDLETVKGQQILLDDFGMGAYALLVTEGMDMGAQQSLETALQEVPHVKAVVGYASLTRGMIPLALVPEQLRQRFVNGSCMLSAVFFDSGSSSEETMDAIEQMRSIAGEKCFISGLSAVITDTRDLVESQEAIYVGIAVALCALVMMLVLDSFLLPLIFLLCIGISVLWNLGSNYFLGEISYITKAVAAVLQLGVTLDYSIFLWHSYKEQKAQCEDRDEAMAQAVCQTFNSILGSGLTTISGFVSICFMSFTLGKDLGIVMSKGVVMGLIGTLVLLPCVLRALDKAIEKTSHRPLLIDMAGVGRFVAKHYRILAVLALILAVPAFYGYSRVNVYYDMSKVMPERLPSIQANNKLSDEFDMSTAHLLLVSADLTKEQTASLASELSAVDGVKDVLGAHTIDQLDLPALVKGMLPKELTSSLKGETWQLMLIDSSYVISSDEVNRQIDSLNEIVKRYDPSGMLIGEAPCTKDLIACTDVDFQRVSIISIAAIFVIILLTQKSLSLPLLLVALIELAIAANLCVPYYTNVQLPFVGPILISTIQLGATVDYAILMTTRYKQFRLGSLNRTDAAAKAVELSAPSLLVSGFGFFAATYGVSVYSDIDIISSMCRLIARGALVSVAVVIFLLPPILIALDKLVIKTTLDMRNL